MIADQDLSAVGSMENNLKSARVLPSHRTIVNAAGRGWQGLAGTLVGLA
jgi:hypothetical protein